MWGAKPKKNISMKGKKTQWGVIHKKYQEGGGVYIKKRFDGGPVRVKRFRNIKVLPITPKGRLNIRRT